MIHSFARTDTAKPFRLSRWFASVGLIAIVLLSVTSAELLSLLFTNRMLGQEGALTTQFVQNMIVRPPPQSQAGLSNPGTLRL